MYVSRELKALEELGYSQNDMLLVSSDVSYLLHPLKNASVFQHRQCLVMVSWGWQDAGCKFEKQGMYSKDGQDGWIVVCVQKCTIPLKRFGTGKILLLFSKNALLKSDSKDITKDFYFK